MGAYEKGHTIGLKAVRAQRDGRQKEAGSYFARLKEELYKLRRSGRFKEAQSMQNGAADAAKFARVGGDPSRRRGKRRAKGGRKDRYHLGKATARFVKYTGCWHPWIKGDGMITGKYRSKAKAIAAARKHLRAFARERSKLPKFQWTYID